MRRLTGDEHLSLEFATTWRTYDLDEKTRALLDYAEKLTKAPSTVDDADFEALRRAGWDEEGIYEATALAALFNFSGRLEAASGLPPDEVPAGARLPEARAGASASRES
ncbi:MAG: carboxymuconolactone decarboxylase family protein [bacterium]